MPLRQRRFFLCNGKCVDYDKLHEHPTSHIIGELRYVTDEGRKVTALALYETPVSSGVVPPIAPSIIVYIVGDARMIKCRFAGCNRSQRWELGRAGFLALMNRMGYQDRFLELERKEEDHHEPVA
jgi:hypothetical protein